MINNTMTNQSNIERIVMRRVRTIRVVRAMFTPGVLAALVCTAALWGIGREVWVARVFQNMPSSADPLSVSYFYLSAFINTRLVVQALAATMLASVVYLARECSRLIIARVSTASFA